MTTISPSLLSPLRQAYHGLGSRSQGAIYKYVFFIKNSQEHLLICDIFSRRLTSGEVKYGHG